LVRIFGRGWIGIFLSGHQEEEEVEEEESLQVWMQVFRRPSALYRSNCSSNLNIGQAMGSKNLLLLSQICQVRPGLQIRAMVLDKGYHATAAHITVLVSVLRV
jgi:hypothetical protein